MKIVRWYKSFLQMLPASLNSFFVSTLEKKLQKRFKSLDRQFIFSQELSAIVKLEIGLNEKDNVKDMISKVEGLIDNYASMNSILETILKDYPNAKLNLIEEYNTTILKIIESFYETLRSLKRKSDISQIETSQLAKDAASQSAHSLNRVLYGN